MPKLTNWHPEAYFNYISSKILIFSSKTKHICKCCLQNVIHFVRHQCVKIKFMVTNLIAPDPPTCLMQCFMATYLDLLHLICIKHITCPSSSIDWWDKKADKKVQIKPGIHLTEQFMSSGFKYCENECNFYMKYCNPISLQFCTCHGSFPVVTSANLWPDWIIGTDIRAEEISTRF